MHFQTSGARGTAFQTLSSPWQALSSPAFVRCVFLCRLQVHCQPGHLCFSTCTRRLAPLPPSSAEAVTPTHSVQTGWSPATAPDQLGGISWTCISSKINCLTSPHDPSPGAGEHVPLGARRGGQRHSPAPALAPRTSVTC